MQQHSSARIEYWSTTLKFIGFFLAGVIITKTGMSKLLESATSTETI